MARFSEKLTIDDQDEIIILAALLGGVWPQSLFMAELAWKTPMTLQEFMVKAKEFMNTEDTIRAFIEQTQKER